MTVLHLALIIFYSIALLSLSFIGIKKKISLLFPVIVLIGVMIRIFVLLSFIGLVHYDTISYKLIGTLTLDWKSIYPDFAYYHYPYFPGFNYVEALSIFLATYGIPYMLFLKLFFCLFDIGNIFLLYALSKKNIQVAFLYAVNPAMIFLSAAHGQIEAIPIFFSLLALYFFQHHKEYIASIALGFAILTKVWPALFLPFFLKYSGKWKIYSISIAIPALSVLLYTILFHTSMRDVLHPAFSYRGSYGAWGISVLFHFLVPQDQGINNTIYKLITNITILILFFVTLVRKKETLVKEIFIFLLLFGALVVSGANPLWLLPFMFLLRPHRWIHWMMAMNVYWVITMIAEVASMVHTSWNTFFIQLELLTAYIVWFVNIRIVLDYAHSLLLDVQKFIEVFKKKLF